MVKQRYLVLLLAALLALPAVAEEAQEFPLSLADSLRIALEQNLDLVSARMDPEISAQQVNSQRAAFDPALFGGAEHSESKQQEISNLFSLNERKQDGAQFGIRQDFIFGGDASVDLSGGNTQQSGPLVTAESTYGANINVLLNMPLLNGRGKQAATEQLVLARGDLEISREQLRAQAHTVLETVENAYWDLVAARESLRIAGLSLARAQDLLELNRKKVEVGTLAPIEITEAEAGVASQEETVIIEETRLWDAEDELRRLLAIPESDPMWSASIIPTDEPFFEEVEIDLEAAIATALMERPELYTAKQTLRNRELSERISRRATKPTLDLALAFNPSGNNYESSVDPGPDGIPGTPDDIVSTTTDGKLNESVKEIFDVDNYSWSAGLNFSLPIGNKAAKASYAIARINKDKARIDLDNQLQSIRVEVRRAVRNVESGVKRVNAARANVELQKKKLDAEHKKYDNGMSTSFEILTFQRDLATAELALVNAHLDYIKSLVALEMSKGTLLQARGLSLAE
jgi:outer membrane protein